MDSIGQKIEVREKTISGTFLAQSWTYDDYDNLDRLTVFNDNTGGHNQSYDLRGRITSNSRLGFYGYTGTSYQQLDLDLNPTADLYYQTREQQDISYTAFKSPIEIHEPGHDRYSFQYNSSQQRANMFYGDENSNSLLRPKRRHYSEAGSMEIHKDLVGGQTTFVFFLGGDAYSAPALWKETYSSAPTVQNLYYLHRDHLGSIVLINDADGNPVEKRQFDAWGNIVKLTDGFGTNIPIFVITDRGFTGHEHLQSVGLVHMNARLYDPLLGRFLGPDNYVQDPLGTQNFNRYGYALNNPLVYSDPSGEFLEWIGISFVYDFFRTAFFKGGLDPTSSSARNNAWRNFDPSAEWSITNKAFKISNGNVKTDPNKNFWGRTWELISRFIWQAPQHSFVYAYSNIHNLFGGVRSVNYYGGATVIESFSDGETAVTLANFIVGDRGIQADPNNPLFQHEYGHYLQSQESGVFYLARYGFPSHQSRHGHRVHPVERDANRRAFRYFSENVRGFNFTTEDGVLGTGWNSVSNPIDGYDWQRTYLDPQNQNALRSNRLSLAWHNYIIGPSPIVSGLLNAWILNSRNRRR